MKKIITLVIVGTMFITTASGVSAAFNLGSYPSNLGGYPQNLGAPASNLGSLPQGLGQTVIP